MSKVIAQDQLFQSIRELVQKTKQNIVRNVNTTMLFTYFEIGRWIIENEQ
jgi:hypothetical protein